MDSAAICRDLIPRIVSRDWLSNVNEIFFYVVVLRNIEGYIYMHTSLTYLFKGYHQFFEDNNIPFVIMFPLITLNDILSSKTGLLFKLRNITARI